MKDKVEIKDEQLQEVAEESAELTEEESEILLGAHSVLVLELIKTQQDVILEKLDLILKAVTRAVPEKPNTVRPVLADPRIRQQEIDHQRALRRQSHLKT